MKNSKILIGLLFLMIFVSCKTTKVESEKTVSKKSTKYTVVQLSEKSEYLNSLLILPLLYSLRNIKDAFDSLFVKAYIADNYITVRRGFFSTKYDKLYITEVNNIEYYRSLGGKICGYGELDFYAFGGMLSLPYLKEDKHNLQIIREIVKIVNKNISLDIAI